MTTEIVESVKSILEELDTEIEAYDVSDFRINLDVLASVLKDAPELNSEFASSAPDLEEVLTALEIEGVIDAGTSKIAGELMGYCSILDYGPDEETLKLAEEKRTELLSLIKKALLE